jgi:hypothetical protein
MLTHQKMLDHGNLIASVRMLGVAALLAVAASAQAGNAARGPVAPEREAQVAAPVVGATTFSLFSKAAQGVVQLDLAKERAVFSDLNYANMIFHVGAAHATAIIERANAELKAGKTVILDSDGSKKQALLVQHISMELAGSGPATEAVSIERNPDGSFLVTPLVSSDNIKPQPGLTREAALNTGNAVKNVLMNRQ